MPDVSPAGASAPVFAFYLSSDISAQVSFRVDRLLGRIPAYKDVEMAPGGSVSPSSLFTIATLCDEAGPLGPAARTPFTEAALTGAAWEHHLSFDPRYRDLRPSTQLAITVWEIREGAPTPVPLGGATLRLFSKKGRLKTGHHVLQLWKNQEADESYPTSTPAKLPADARGEKGRIERALKHLQRGDFESLPWLDGLAVAAAESALLEESKRSLPCKLQLAIDLAEFDLPVVFDDVTLPAMTAVGGGGGGALAGEGTAEALHTPLPGTAGAGAAAAAAAAGHSTAHLPQTSTGGTAALSSSPPSPPSSTSLESLWLSNRLTILHDPELGKDTPAEIKAQKLARSSGRGVLDESLRPNTLERGKIDAALALPPGQPLGREDRELLWRFRTALTSEPRALTKFFKCVDWSDAAETEQALKLAGRWAGISVADALELLSPDYTVEAVRAHAVHALERTQDDELLLYLLQLVQALRYESVDDSQLAMFLVARARQSAAVASALFWYLCAELQDPSFTQRAEAVQAALLAPPTRQRELFAGRGTGAALGTSAAVVVEEEDTVLPADCISLQINLVARLRHLSDEKREPMEGKRGPPRTARQMTAKVREVLSQGRACHDLTTFECPCPLDPAVRLHGIIPEECAVFASKINPLKVAFKVDVPREQQEELWDAGEGGYGGDGGNAAMAERRAQPGDDNAAGSSCTPEPSREVKTADGVVSQETVAVASSGVPRSLALLYKRGDDLRQDQLILQLISLMDRLLKHEHTDLCITAYAVLPTSSSDGLIEFVPGAYTISSVQAQYGSVAAFLAAHHPHPNAPMGMRPEVLENYVRSCAGCMVVAHVLGIGDRHLDNIMLTTDGKLFHIDFGYAFGRDPKMGNNASLVLSPVLVEGMGGSGGAGYSKFATLCAEAFNILRKSARLLLSLVHLMAGSSITDIRSDPERAVLKVQERLRLDLSDDDAEELLKGMLKAASEALLPRLAEGMHRAAQLFR